MVPDEAAFPVRYIHHDPDWPAYRWDAAALADRLAAVRHQQGLLLGRMQGLGFRLRDEAALESLTHEVVTSSAIEGEILPRDQVRSSIARRLGIDAGALSPAARSVEGVVEMALDATERFGEPLTAQRLFSWHAALFPTGRSGMDRITVGAWRQESMSVVSGPFGREHVHYEAPEAVAAFLDWFETPGTYDPVLKAGLAHLWFVQIHPFEDGNGRIGRAIMDMALARADGVAMRFYSVSGQILGEQKEYYAALEEAGRGTLDVTEWMMWFLGCLGRALRHAQRVTDWVLARARFWESLTSVPLNERQRLMLHRLTEGFEGKLTAKKWGQITKRSHDTALRDIEDLIAKGVLVADGAGGRSSSYSLAPGRLRTEP